MKVPERQPYAGELAFTAFSGSHQDAIRKGYEYMAESDTPYWEVPYLPINPADLSREYEPVIRINSQSGKGGAAFVLQHAVGYRLPKEMHPEFGNIVKAASDAFGDELKSQVSWPTHVAVLGDDNIYLRDNGGIKLFHPSTGEATLIEGTKGARKNTMAVVGGKVFASQNKNLLVIESGKDKVSATVEFDGNISGVVKSSDNNVWVSVSTGKIAKVSAKDYSIIKENDLSADKDATKTLSASFAAAPSITAKGDTLYMSGLATKVYRHIFSTNETKLMVDAKEMVENANIVYNTVAVDPVTEGVYLNTIKGYGDNVSINQISIFDFSRATPTLKAHYNDCTRYPAGVFFTSNFR